MNTAKLQLTHLAQTVLSGLLYLSLYITQRKTLLEALDLKTKTPGQTEVLTSEFILLALCQSSDFTNELLQVLFFPLAEIKFLLNTHTLLEY